jgi:PKD repeat protein
MAKTHSEVTDFKGAKDALWQDACDYVSEIVIIYFVSNLYDLTYDKSEIKEYKKDKEGTYDYYKNYYGETNALAAYQFDALMNYFVDADTNEETGAVTYKNITYVIKAD